MITQKILEVDTDLQKRDTGMIYDVQGSKRNKKKIKKNRLNQDFSKDYNNDKKMKKALARALARKRYSAIKVMARNLLANIAYRRNKKSDFNNGFFVTDVYSFLLQNLNPLMIIENLIMKMIDNGLKCCGKIVYCYNLLDISFFMIIFWLPPK